MKIKGAKIDGPEKQVVVFVRGEKDIVFQAQAVLDYDVFDTLYPEPIPPRIQRRGEETGSADKDDPEYKEALSKRATARFKWMILKSLEATEGLDWEHVKLNDPETYSMLEKELEQSGLTAAEVGQIYSIVMKANSLDSKLMEEAKKRFMSGAAKTEKSEK